MQFHINQLLLLIALVAAIVGSLWQASAIWEIACFSGVLLTLLLAVAVAIGGSGQARVFSLTYAITAGGYLLFAHTPDMAGQVPRYFGPEGTTVLLRVALDQIHGDNLVTPPGPTGGMFNVADEEAPWSNLSLIITGGQQVMTTPDSTAFLRIGHVWWALLLGVLNGKLAQRCYRRQLARGSAPQQPS